MISYQKPIYGDLSKWKSRQEFLTKNGAESGSGNARDLPVKTVSPALSGW